MPFTALLHALLTLGVLIIQPPQQPPTTLTAQQLTATITPGQLILAATPDSLLHKSDWQLIWQNPPTTTPTYTTTAQGLTQRFTIVRRTSHPLNLAFHYTSLLTPRLNNSANLYFVQGTVPRLRYAALRVQDARGQAVPAHLELQPKQVQIVISDAKAQYPLTVEAIFSTRVQDRVGERSGAFFGGWWPPWAM